MNTNLVFISKILYYLTNLNHDESKNKRHSFCAKIYTSDLKNDCIKNIYKVREQLLSCRTDIKTS